MKYFLAVNFQKKCDGKNISVLKEIRELSQVEIDTFNNALFAVFEYRKFANTIYLLEANYLEFKEFLKKPLELTDYMGHDEKINNTLLNANRIFMNLLFSFTAAHDHIKEALDKIKRKDFEESTTALFDDCLAYRFICKLRNYAQHFNLPITDILIDEYLEKENLKSVTNFVVSRDELLKYKSWTVVREELENFEKNFEITILINEAITKLILLFEKYKDSKLQSIDKDLLALSDFIIEINKFSAENGLDCIYPFIGQINEQNQPMMIHFPLKLLVDLNYITLKNMCE